MKIIVLILLTLLGVSVSAKKTSSYWYPTLFIESSRNWQDITVMVDKNNPIQALRIDETVSKVVLYIKTRGTEEFVKYKHQFFKKGNASVFDVEEPLVLGNIENLSFFQTAKYEIIQELGAVTLQIINGSITRRVLFANKFQGYTFQGIEFDLPHIFIASRYILKYPLAANSHPLNIQASGNVSGQTDITKLTFESIAHNPYDFGYASYVVSCDFKAMKKEKYLLIFYQNGFRLFEFGWIDSKKRAPQLKALKFHFVKIR